MRGVFIHGLLALFGLAFAYQTWTRKPETDEAESASKVTIAQCEPEALQLLHMETPTNHILIEPERKAGRTQYWVTTRRKSEAEIENIEPSGPTHAKKAPSATSVAQPPPAAPVDDQAPDATAAANKVDATKPKHFLANATFIEYLERLTPVRVLRALGKLPKEKLEGFGFDKVGTFITLGCGGKTLSLEVGARTFGTGQRYVRDAASHDAYLVDESFVADLQSAQFKFMQTDLHSFTLADVGEATLSARGTHKKLLHRDRKLGDRATWVDASAPTKRNEAYANWFSRLSRLRVRDFLVEGVEPGSELSGAVGEVTPVLSMQYATDGKQLGKLELVRISAGDQNRYYARSETTKVWVTLFDTSAKDVEQDLALVLSTEVPASKP